MPSPSPSASREPVRASFERALLALWFGDPRTPRNRVLGALLAPLAGLAARIARRRRARIRRLAPAERPAVIVVGNLLVGGTGKTPVAIELALQLAARGRRVGMLAGGYRARRSEARIVGPDDQAAEHGDEAVLLARASGLPVAAGRRRGEALALLCAHHPELEIVVGDDGLQQPGLPRTLEVAVFDARGTGNGRLLPAGPLREPLGHLASMDAMLLNGDARAPAASPPAFRFDVAASGFRSLASDERLEPAQFAAFAAGRRIDAVAGIAQPARFFASLRALGLAVDEHPLPDHARIDAGVIDALRAPLVVMTAKDAVKCAGIADPRCWVLDTRARIDPAFVSWIEERLRGPSTA